MAYIGSKVQISNPTASPSDPIARRYRCGVPHATIHPRGAASYLWSANITDVAHSLAKSHHRVTAPLGYAIGLIYLTTDGLAPYVATWWRRYRAATVCAASLALLVVIGSNLIALPVMAHELRIDQLHRLIARLDQKYAGRHEAILTPYAYTDFHYLKFIYPDRPMHTV